LFAIEPADGDECARIVYEAFAGVHDDHRFPRDFPTLEAASQLTDSLIAQPRIWGVVAEAVPTRQAGLFRWCLSQGLRPIKPLTYMTLGEYREPDGGWIPSMLY
jgi:hypothetical protein